jgi:hypothetical protein
MYFFSVVHFIPVVRFYDLLLYNRLYFIARRGRERVVFKIAREQFVLVYRCNPYGFLDPVDPERQLLTDSGIEVGPTYCGFHGCLFDNP